MHRWAYQGRSRSAGWHSMPAVAKPLSPVAPWLLCVPTLFQPPRKRCADHPHCTVETEGNFQQTPSVLEKRLSEDERLHTRCLHTESLPTPSRDSAQLRLPAAPSPPSHDGDNTTNSDKQAAWPGSHVSSLSFRGSGSGSTHTQREWKTTLTVMQGNCFPFTRAETKIAASL